MTQNQIHNQHVADYYYYIEVEDNYEESYIQIWLSSDDQRYGSAEHQVFGDAYLYNDCQGAW